MPKNCSNCVYYDIVTFTCEALDRLMPSSTGCNGFTSILDLEDVIDLESMDTELYNVENEDHI